MLSADTTPALGVASQLNLAQSPATSGDVIVTLVSIITTSVLMVAEFFVQEAVYAAREDAGLGSGFFRMDSPATPERLRMACADHITAPFAPPDGCIRTSC